MSKRPINAVASDFANVLSLLKERGVSPANPGTEFVANAKRIHGLTYSLILWRFRLRNLSPHSSPFIEEIASDALQVLPQILMGFSKTAKLLMRGVLENTLRYIYFVDHPIEFARMNREKKWFLTIEELCSYAKMHPSFLETEPKFDAINRVTSLYSVLSSRVHGRTVRDLEMRTALSRIHYDHRTATQDADELQKCVAVVNFLIAVLNAHKVRAFSAEDRRIVLRSMPTIAREAFVDFG